MDKNKPLIDEIKRTGFLLEWKVAQILHQCDYDVEQNLLLRSLSSSESSPDRLFELDVFARLPGSIHPDEVLLVECKGAGQQDKLVVIPSQQQEIAIPSILFNESTVFTDHSKPVLCNNSPRSHQPFFCHTGDFFTAKGDGFTKAGKQEERSNLYKGICQLHPVIDGVFRRNRLERNRNSLLRIWPMIVTNAEINVAIFDQDESKVSLQSVPWVAHQNPLIYSSESKMDLANVSWKVTDTVSPTPEKDLRRIPAVWVVNVDYLQGFLEKNSKKYPE